MTWAITYSMYYIYIYIYMYVYVYTYIFVYIYIYIYIYVNGLCTYLKDTEVIVSVQVRLKTHPWGQPAGFLLPEAVGHERVRHQRSSHWELIFLSTIYLMPQLA